MEPLQSLPGFWTKYNIMGQTYDLKLMTQYRLNIMAVSDPGFIDIGKGFVTVSQQNI